MLSSRPPQSSSSRCKWKKLLALFLSSLLLVHFSTTAIAQEASVFNSATASYATTSGARVDTVSNQISVSLGEGDPGEGGLIDPIGIVRGCDGQPLDSYAGFFMALYEPDATGLDIGNIVDLEDTTLENGGLAPNVLNVNPFPLTEDEGRYNFLLGTTKDLESPINTGLFQTEANAQYILVINPPENSDYTERRVLIELLATVDLKEGSTLSYRATSLDGNPISVDGSLTFVNTVPANIVAIDDSVEEALTFEIGLDTTICESQQVRIVKSADRSAAQPGDTVVYRLSIQSLATVEINSIIAMDTLPVGFELIVNSVSGQLDSASVQVNTRTNGNSVGFSVAESVAADQALDIIYAVRITPDALRGTGQNDAIVTAKRTDNDFDLQDGPSSHRMNLEPGILSDCGTLIGRVFEDKNFDGEQQSGEVGIPNAVVFLDDGNRIVTDADGLFSVQKMLPGQRVGTLDISSLPGYTLAPNLYFNERNSQSRLVNLAPGGLVKMNFGVTPTFQEVKN